MQLAFGQRNRQREVADIAERKTEDKTLDLLLRVRKQRLDRVEQERRIAREAWREQRAQLHQAKRERDQAQNDARQYWSDARSQFMSMVTTSGDYRKAKAVYQRMKDKAAERYTECLEAVQTCRTSRAAFFETRKRLLEARRQHEKLGMMLDEKRALAQTGEV